MPNGNNDIESPEDPTESKVVSLKHRALQRVNFASAQNDVAIIEEITVEKPTDEALADVRITLRAAPPIIREKSWTIDRVGPARAPKANEWCTACAPALIAPAYLGTEWRTGTTRVPSVAWQSAGPLALAVRTVRVR